MSEEIFVNTGTSFQQPYIARQPTIGTAPTIGTVPARQPADTQTPFTYQNRSPFTYRNPVSNQTPFTYQNRTPTTYERQGQTPFTYDNRQPGTYERQGQTPFTYQNRTSTTYARQGQTPFTYQARTPSIYQHVTTQQTPFIGQARQPNIYQHVTSQQTPFIGQARQPAIYQHVTTQQTPFTFDIRSPSIGNARQPSITTVQQTITETNINNSLEGYCNATYNNSSHQNVSSSIARQNKFVFSNGTTNVSGATARKLSIYMLAAIQVYSSATSNPSGLHQGFVLMAEFETPSGFAPDSYALDMTSSSATQQGFGSASRTFGSVSGVATIPESYLNSTQYMTWAGGSGGAGFTTTLEVSRLCASMTGFGDMYLDLYYRKSGYPDLLVDTLRIQDRLYMGYTGAPGNCFL